MFSEYGLLILLVVAIAYKLIPNYKVASWLMGGTFGVIGIMGLIDLLVKSDLIGVTRLGFPRWYLVAVIVSGFVSMYMFAWYRPRKRRSTE